MHPLSAERPLVQICLIVSVTLMLGCNFPAELPNADDGGTLLGHHLRGKRYANFLLLLEAETRTRPSWPLRQGQLSGHVLSCWGLDLRPWGGYVEAESSKPCALLLATCSCLLPGNTQAWLRHWPTSATLVTQLHNTPSLLTAPVLGEVISAQTSTSRTQRSPGKYHPSQQRIAAATWPPTWAAEPQPRILSPKVRFQFQV